MKLQTPLTLIDVANLLSCDYVGPPDHQILGINEIHRVETGDLTFVDVEKYYQKAFDSKATTILIDKKVDPPPGKSLLITQHPFTAFNQLTDYVRPRLSLHHTGKPPSSQSPNKIAAGVVFGEGVELGEQVEIGANTVIGSHVTIGPRTIIYPNVTLADYVKIGADCIIQAGTVIGGEAFYYKRTETGHQKMLTRGQVRIENGVDIGANCTIDNGVTAETVIGEGTKIDNLVQIGHDSIIGKRCIIAAQVGIAGCVIIEDDVKLWGQVGIIQNVRIGAGAQLYGKTGVMHSLPGGKTYLGMIGVEARTKMREIAALRKLPEFIQRVEAWMKSRE